MRQAKFLAVLGMLALAGCGGDSGPAPIQAEGNWQGTTQNGTVLALTLTETNGAVQGTGTFTTPSESIPLTGTGTYVEPQLSFTIAAEGFNNLNLTTTVGESRMTGTLNGSGFLNESISLDRK